MKGLELSEVTSVFCWSRHVKKIPSGYVKIAIENDPVEIVEFSIENGGSFQFVMLRSLPEGHILTGHKATFLVVFTW